MADSNITIAQAWDGIDYSASDQDYKEDSATVTYIVGGTDSELAAVNAVAESSSVPTEFKRTDTDENPIPRKSVSVEERLTQTDWKVNVTYQYENSSGGFGDAGGESTYSFDISTSSKHIVFSRSTRNRYPSSAKNSAGINDGDGTDVLMPVSRFSETHYFSASKVSQSYMQRLNRMVGKVNSSSFKGYDAHEVLFIGANGTRTGRDKWQITFNFAVSENESGITIGSFTGISKRGWDVIWARYKETSNSGSSEILRTVKAVFVEQVYKDADFSTLGIN